MKVAFQGEIGAFSEVAVREMFPQADAVPMQSFSDVFDAVDNGIVDACLIPIENSLFGSVHANYDLLREHDLTITGEVHLRIRHNLMGLAGTTASDITAVFSHPQAIGQCRAYLERHLSGAEARPYYDTAGAARMVGESGRSDWAAIASERAAATYGLEILAGGIETNHQNYTRFLALEHPANGHVTPGRDGDLKTSIVYAMQQNVPGSLFKSLAVFALREIDLYKIESRPLVGSPGEYVFYLDLGGSASDDHVQKAIDHLEEIAAFVKVLGSYPKGGVVD